MEAEEQLVVERGTAGRKISDYMCRGATKNRVISRDHGERNLGKHYCSLRVAVGFSGGNTDGVQGGHEECQKRLNFLMAERVERAHLNRVLPSSTELKRPHMRTKEEERGDLPPTKRHHDFITVTSPA